MGCWANQEHIIHEATKRSRLAARVPSFPQLSRVLAAVASPAVHAKWLTIRLSWRRISSFLRKPVGQHPSMWSILYRRMFSSGLTLSVHREIRTAMSKRFERWKELASLTSRERDPAKLTELAHEMNLVLIQKVPFLDPPPPAAFARTGPTRGSESKH